MPFVKKLARLGNSFAIVIDRPFLRQLDLRPDAEVEVSLESDAIVIRPHRYASDKDAKAAGRKVLRGRRALMERLAK